MKPEDRKWWVLEDDEGFSDEQRARMLTALHATDGFNGYPFQDTVDCVGRAAQREGISFDESLNRYFISYVISLLSN